MTTTTTRGTHGCRIEPLSAVGTSAVRQAHRGPINITDTLAHSPDVARRLTAFGGALFEDSLISPREREIVILRVGWCCQSVYEFGQHTIFGREVGLVDAEIAGLAGGPQRWSDAEAALVALVDELCATDDVTDRTWAVLAAHYSRRQLVELLLLAGYYRMISGLLNTAGVELEPWTPSWPVTDGHAIVGGRS